MAFLLFIFNQSNFLNVKNWCICQFLFFDRRTNQLDGGTVPGETYETQNLVPYDFTIEPVVRHPGCAFLFAGDEPSPSRPGRDGFAV